MMRYPIAPSPTGLFSIVMNPNYEFCSVSFNPPRRIGKLLRYDFITEDDLRMILNHETNHFERGPITGWVDEDDNVVLVYQDHKERKYSLNQDDLSFIFRVCEAFNRELRELYPLEENEGRYEDEGTEGANDNDRVDSRA